MRASHHRHIYYDFVFTLCHSLVSALLRRSACPSAGERCHRAVTDVSLPPLTEPGSPSICPVRALQDSRSTLVVTDTRTWERPSTALGPSTAELAGVHLHVTTQRHHPVFITENTLCLAPGGGRQCQVAPNIAIDFVCACVCTHTCVLVPTEIRRQGSLPCHSQQSRCSVRLANWLAGEPWIFRSPPPWCCGLQACLAFIWTGDLNSGPHSLRSRHFAN